MSKKKILIHVGPPKTGTSVLQHWFNNNKDWLLSHSVYYPAHEVDSNNVSSGHKNLFLERKPDTTRTSFSTILFEKVLKEFKLSGCETLLLSSEFFFYQIPQFFSYNDEFDLKFIAYVRADIDLVESLYNQSVKRNGQVKPLPIRATLPSSYLDDLETFIKDYSADMFSLRAYGDDSVFSGQDIVTDFMCELDIDVLSRPPSNSAKINSSYSFEALEFKRWLNQFSLGEFESEIDFFLQAISSGYMSYSLIPSEAFEQYKAQSIAKIESLNQQAVINNCDKLLHYLNNKVRANYMHQELYPQHLNRIVQQLAGSNPTLLNRLTMALLPQICSERDSIHFQTITHWNNLVNDSRSKPKNRFIKALNWLNKRRSK
ncbi:hypothetical protein FJ444_17840 [Aestuariibacter sp. GS-14]|uniref:hypothetical protein n=1 Tax=Aestuariibacter sp. GS-14 TaxID=2590670 RepID=UPI00112AF3F3|nr:hypothetical protein [Aestuariibacter sp. GS-14]TPV55120.1 hypothetical protein FJ444_17840 [Aestuariibacter sp. GS-14]